MQTFQEERKLTSTFYSALGNIIKYPLSLSHSAQLQLARMTLLEILALPVGERMAYIAHSRLVRQQRRQREERVSV